VHIGVAQPVGRETVQHRCLYQTSKARQLPEFHIIENENQNVRYPSRAWGGVSHAGLYSSLGPPDHTGNGSPSLYVTRLLIRLTPSSPNDHDVFSLTEPHRPYRHPVRVMTLPVACGVVIVGLANKEDQK
jgi:hypothetical protein